jgi:hypothetical protein
MDNKYIRVLDSSGLSVKWVGLAMDNKYIGVLDSGWISMRVVSAYSLFPELMRIIFFIRARWCSICRRFDDLAGSKRIARGAVKFRHFDRSMERCKHQSEIST